MIAFHEAAQARREAVRAPSDRPSQRRSSADVTALATVRTVLEPQELRQIERNGLNVVQVTGLASVTESPYEMHDAFGPYMEVVTRTAFGATLDESPLVEFTVNHGAGGALPMAHTRNGTLDLLQEDSGLRYEAFVDPERHDVQDMLLAMKRGDLAESSFKFRITKGVWSEDYSEYRIDAVDLSRGDVSAVNFGANPAATSGLRAQPKPAEARSDSRLKMLSLRLALELANED